jgi:hypothetical protein
MTQGAPVFDLAPIVEEFLDKHSTSITRGDIEDLRDRCVSSLQVFFSSQPEVAANARPGVLSRIFIATFDRKTLVSSVWSFALKADGLLLPRPTGGEMSVLIWRTMDKGDAYIVGESEYFNQYVKLGAASQVHCKPTVSATDERYGKWIATGLIRATSRTAEKIPAPSGIGGPIDIAFVNGRSKITLERITNTSTDDPSTPASN